MEIIKSKDNSKIKYVRSLNSKKSREQSSSFVVEGIKFVKETILENANIKFLLLSTSGVQKIEILEIINICEEKNIDYFIAEDVIFDYASDTIHAQGILAVVNKQNYETEKVLNSYKFIILCDRIQDPGNLGTIIRTADAFGPAAIILNKGCADAYNPKVVRATAGALFRVPILIDFENSFIFENLKNNDFKVISTVVNSDHYFDDVEKTEKICVVIGNEGSGVSQEIIQNSDISITIKMSGNAESLNASIAAGISIYEIRKKLL